MFGADFISGFDFASSFVFDTGAYCMQVRDGDMLVVRLERRVHVRPVDGS